MRSTPSSLGDGASSAAEMIRALPVPLTVRWQPFFVVGWFALSVGLLFLPVIIALLFMPHDWMIYSQIPRRLASGELYANEWPAYFIALPPLTAWLIAALVPLGYSFWWMLHVAVVPLLRDWRLIALTVVSVPFWIETMIGSTMIWGFVAGAVALRGSRVAGLIYLALFLLLPRPIYLPLAAWLLWQRPDLRWPFAGMVAIVAVTTLASGMTLSWLGNLLFVGTSHYSDPHNFSPTRLVGSAWLLVAVPLAALLTWRGRVGLAGLALTPYLLPPYLLLLLWELRTPGTPRPRSAPGSIPSLAATRP